MSDHPRVYFIRRGDFIKIGTTRYRFIRASQIAAGQCALPHELLRQGRAGIARVLGYVWGGEATEQALHCAFGTWRVPGTEWFRVTPLLLDYIAREAWMVPPERPAVTA